MFMIYLKKIFVGLLMMLSAGVNVSAADYFLTTDVGHDKNGEYYLCQNLDGLWIMPVWTGGGEEPTVNVKWYASPINSTEVDMSAPIKEKNNVLISSAEYNVRSSMFDVRTAQTSQNRTFKVVTEYVETGDVQESEITIVARYVPLPTEIKMPSFCAGGGTLAALTLTKFFDTDKYSWYDENGKSIKGMAEVLAISQKPAGSYTYFASAKDGKCLSDKLELTLNINGKVTADLNYAFVTYSSDEDYENDVQQQSLKMNGGLLADGEGCKYKWYSPEKKELTSPYKPEPRAEAGQTMTVAYVSQDCGCGYGPLTPYTIVCSKLAPPDVADLNMCYDESKATLPVVHKATINTISEFDEKSNYYLELSEIPDFSVSIKGEPGEENLDLMTVGGKPGVHTYYLRQVRLDGAMSGVASFNVTVLQVSEPGMKSAHVKEGTCSLNLNNYLDSEGYSNLEWYDAAKSPLASSTGISVSSGEDKEFYARIFSDKSGEKCYSKYVPLTITGVALNPTVSEGTSVCLNSPLKLVSSGNNKDSHVTWDKAPSWVECSYSADSSENVIKVSEAKDFTLTSTISLYSCKYDYPMAFTVNTPSLEGTVKIARDDNSIDSYETSEKLQFRSCNLNSRVIVDVPHTGYAIKVVYPSGKSKDCPFSMPFTSFQADEWGTYKISYENECPLSFEVSLTRPLVEGAKLTKNEVSFCKDETQSIDLSSYLVGTPSGFWTDDKDKELANTVVDLSAIDKYVNEYSFYPNTVIVSQSGKETKCLGKPIKLKVLVDSLGLEISGDSLLCPDEVVTLSAKSQALDSRSVGYTWNVSPSNATVSSNLSGTMIDCVGKEDVVYVTLTASTKVCSKSIEKTLTVGQKEAKGTISALHKGAAVKTINVEEQNFNIAYCSGQQVRFDLEHTKDEYTLILPSGVSSTESFSNRTPFSLVAPGVYTIKYMNGCESEYSFEASAEKRPQLKESVVQACPNSSTYIEVMNTQGCIIELEGVSEKFTDGKIRFDSKGEGSYNKLYKVTCDGCERRPMDQLNVDVMDGGGLGEQLYVETYGSHICIGGEVQVNRVYTVPPSRFTIQWEDNPDIIGDRTTQQIKIKPNIKDWKPGELSREILYSATLTSTDVCADPSKRKAVDNVSIIVGRPFDAEIVGPSLICYGEESLLTVPNMDSKTMYEWKSSTDDKVNGKTTGTVSASPEIGTNDYSVTITRDGCTVTKTHTLNVGSIPQINEIKQSSMGDVKLSASSLSGKQLIYSIGKTEFPDGDFGRLSPGQYNVKISEVDGCVNDTNIVVEEPKLLVMPFFTPNGDGENDVISIPNNMLEYKNTEMTVYDRWGKKVAYLNNDNPDWDGTYNGKPMPSADYWYVLNVNEIRRYYSGHFSLIRN